MIQKIKKVRLESLSFPKKDNIKNDFFDEKNFSICL